MTEPRLTEQAEADLDDLWAYIAANNPDAAESKNELTPTILQGREPAIKFKEISTEMCGTSVSDDKTVLTPFRPS